MCCLCGVVWCGALCAAFDFERISKLLIFKIRTIALVMKRSNNTYTSQRQQKTNKQVHITHNIQQQSQQQQEQIHTNIIHEKNREEPSNHRAAMSTFHVAIHPSDVFPFVCPISVVVCCCCAVLCYVVVFVVQSWMFELVCYELNDV